jgi:hypothetical protein
MFRLWAFLYEIGFLNARFPDERQDRQFRHVMFRMDPGLVSKARWAEMQKATWEVHPAYRSHLIQRGRDEAARVGAVARYRGRTFGVERGDADRGQSRRF